MPVTNLEAMKVEMHMLNAWNNYCFAIDVLVHANDCDCCTHHFVSI